MRGRAGEGVNVEANDSIYMELHCPGHQPLGPVQLQIDQETTLFCR